MKLAILIALTCFVFSTPCFSQSDLPEFGKISTAELLSGECPFAKDAPAYILFSYSKTVFGYPGVNFDITTKRRLRIKIINEKGFDYAKIAIAHIGDKHSGKISDIEAFIYTLDSTGDIIKTKVEKKDIFHINLDKIYNANAVKFTFPGVKPGCVVEYRYERVEKNSYTIEPWILQDRIPVALSYCEINYPINQIMEYHLAGQLPVDPDNFREWPGDTSRSSIKKAFTIKKIPAFRQEPLMSSLVDNIKRMEFFLQPDIGFEMRSPKTLTEKWKLISEGFAASAKYKIQTALTIPGTETLLDSVKALSGVKNKLNALYTAVKKQVTWNHIQTRKFYNISDAWVNKTGNSAYINMILLNLLNKSNITCYPVFISTRENGMVDPEFANMDQFDGLDVLVTDSTDYYILDGSAENLNYSIPPIDVVNRNIFLVAANGYKWVNINETRPLIKDSVYISAIFGEDGIITGESVTYSYDYSRSIRLSGEKDKNHDEKKNDNTLAPADADNFKIDSTWMLNKETDTLPLITHTRFHLLPDSGNNFFFINASAFNIVRKNPLMDSIRTTDIDLQCSQLYKQVINITLPGDFILESVPKSVVIRMIDTSMQFARNIVQRGHTLWLETEFRLNKSFFTSDEYPGVRQFFSKVYGLLAEETILTKKR